MAAPKNNVNVFNADVADNAGYRYTTHASFSSVVANERLTRATVERIAPGVRSVLDLGCGDGTYTAELKQSFPAVRFTGIDAAEAAIKAARVRFPAVDFQVADATRFETFPRDHFDLAIARGVLHHLPDPEAAVANLLRSADEVLIIEPNGNNPLLKVIERASAYHRAHEERSFTARKLRRWCEAAGGQVVSLDYVGFIPFFFPTLPAKLIYQVQPALERVPGLRDVFAGQIVIRARAKTAPGAGR